MLSPDRKCYVPISQVLYINQLTLGQNPHRQPAAWALRVWHAGARSPGALPSLGCHFSSSCTAQVSKSVLKAAPTSAIMSVVVVERPCFWKAWWLHCLVREQAPRAASSSGLELGGGTGHIRGLHTASQQHKGHGGLWPRRADLQLVLRVTCNLKSARPEEGSAPHSMCSHLVTRTGSKKGNRLTKIWALPAILQFCCLLNTSVRTKAWARVCMQQFHGQADLCPGM